MKKLNLMKNRHLYQCGLAVEPYAPQYAVVMKVLAWDAGPTLMLERGVRQARAMVTMTVGAHRTTETQRRKP